MSLQQAGSTGILNPNLGALTMRRQAGAAAEEQQQAQLLASLLDQLQGSGAAVAVVAAAGQRSHVSGALLRPGRLGVEVRLTLSLWVWMGV